MKNGPLAVDASHPPFSPSMKLLQGPNPQRRLRLRQHHQDDALLHHLYVAVAPWIGQSAGQARGARRSPVGEPGPQPWTASASSWTPLTAVLVAPNGYRGFEARIYKCGGHQALSHWEVARR